MKLVETNGRISCRKMGSLMRASLTDDSPKERLSRLTNALTPLSGSSPSMAEGTE